METATQTEKKTGNETLHNNDLRECANPKCHEHFSGKPSKKYCSNKCRVAVQRVSLGNAPAQPTAQPAQTQTALPAKRMETKAFSFPNFPESAQYIIADLKEKVDDLKAEKEKVLKEHKELQEEYKELEESLKNTQAQLEKKPGALAGWVENPDKILQVVQHLPETLRGIKELVREMGGSSGQSAIAGPQGEQQKANDLLAWLASKPEPVQQEFVNMILAFSIANDDDILNWAKFMLIKLPKPKMKVA